MVVEISPDTFACERPGCQVTVTADNPNNKRSRSQAERAATLHEQRDAIHVSILDLSTVPPELKIPDALRRGYVVLLATTKEIKLLSKQISDRAQVEMEASVLMQTLASFDDEKQRGRKRLPQTGSVIATQQHRDYLRYASQLLVPPVRAFKL